MRLLSSFFFEWENGLPRRVTPRNDDGRMDMLESDFQAKLIVELKQRFPGCIVLKNDPGYLQGFPDLTVFYQNKWATLECKKSARSKKQPNQEFYIGYLNEMSFSRFIYPENKEEVLNDLQQAFGA